MRDDFSRAPILLLQQFICVCRLTVNLAFSFLEVGNVRVLFDLLVIQAGTILSSRGNHYVQ